MNDPENDKLILQLQQFPELEPPPNLVSEVMGRIRPVKQPNEPFWRRLFNSLTGPRHITLHPLRIAGATAFAAAVFWFGMEVGMNRVRPVNELDQTNVVEKVLQNPQASFLAGRGLMTAGLAAEALPLLERASLASPDNPEYAYWEGLCYWANNMPAKERSSYMRGINSSPGTIPLLLNLGHNLLEQGELSDALVLYNKVLNISPDEQTALYNSGLIYNMQQDSKNEITAWKTYLKYHRSGINFPRASRAVKRLNNLNDFSYRTYQLGNRKTILSQSALVKMLPTDEFRREVAILAEALRKDPRLQLDIVFFHEDDALTARKKAIVLKKNIIALIGVKEKNRVRLSWFGENESVSISNRNYQLAESLLLFGSRNFIQSKDTKI